MEQASRLPGGGGASDNRLAEPLDAVLDRAPPAWAPLIAGWRASAPGRRLVDFVETRREVGAAIYPAAVLRSLELTPRDAVRVVILGQDPYHGAGQAEGLAFSVPSGVALPPSLRNILAELGRDLGVQHTAGGRLDGHLGGWARQGVLLLNTSLTVEEGRPAAHAKRGWEALTDDIVKSTAMDAGAKVYLLWGAHAQAKAPLIAAFGGGRHRVLCANHPSPLSERRPPTPFVGCAHFSLAQAFLAASSAAAKPIDWSS